MASTRWNDFWALVETAKKGPEQFEHALSRMSQDALIDLYEQFAEIVGDLKGDAFLPHFEGYSEDAIDDTAYRIVEQGEDYYLDVLERPELVTKEVPIADPGFDARGSILKIYQERFGEPLWKRLPHR